MSDEEKSKHWLFAPGNKISVGHGRPRMPAELKKMREADGIVVEQIFRRFANLTVAELKELIKHPAMTVLECCIASTYLHLISKGDIPRLSFFLEVFLGPMVKKIDLTNSDGSLKPRIVELHIPNNNRLYHEEMKDVTPKEEPKEGG